MLVVRAWWEREWGVTDKLVKSYRGDGNVLDLDRDDGGTTL